MRRLSGREKALITGIVESGIIITGILIYRERIIGICTEKETLFLTQQIACNPELTVRKKVVYISCTLISIIVLERLTKVPWIGSKLGRVGDWWKARKNRLPTGNSSTPPLPEGPTGAETNPPKKPRVSPRRGWHFR